MNSSAMGRALRPVLERPSGKCTALAVPGQSGGDTLSVPCRFAARNFFSPLCVPARALLGHNSLSLTGSHQRGKLDAR
jgi:hypothetical protein